ncbi:MAG: 4Fe-4S dicluster domain-containing protein [Tissierellales bacterium]|nr:4Fe-4S dicluster domain-containing protein [Tissierellales bacterium]MBN2827991.1 4Fe-4S dicluster domain-containing protein [Tissierellales bacterium]
MKYITIDLDKCVSCSNCEYACAFAQTEDFARKDSNIRVNYYPETVTSITMTCMHCTDAWCMEVCPANAISKDEATGAVVIDQDQCAGCKMCIMVCPFGNIHFNPTKLVSQKCDLCGGDPNCVKFCISGALQFEEAEELFDSKRTKLDGKLNQLILEGKIKIKGGE